MKIDMGDVVYGHLRSGAGQIIKVRHVDTFGTDAKVGGETWDSANQRWRGGTWVWASTIFKIDRGTPRAPSQPIGAFREVPKRPAQ